MKHLVGVLLLIAAPAFVTTTKDGGVEMTTIKASIDQLFSGYFRWLDADPSRHTMNSLKLRMPRLDVYSPHGKLLYHGDNAAANADFLRKLPATIENNNPPVRAVEAMTLQEYLEMFPDLRAHEGQYTSENKYKVVALTYAGTSLTQQQNEAVEALSRPQTQLPIHIFQIVIQP